MSAEEQEQAEARVCCLPAVSFHREKGVWLEGLMRCDAACRGAPRQQNKGSIVLRRGLIQFSLKAAGVFPLTSVNFGSDHIKLFGRFTPKGTALSFERSQIQFGTLPGIT